MGTTSSAGNTGLMVEVDISGEALKTNVLLHAIRPDQPDGIPNPCARLLMNIDTQLVEDEQRYRSLFENNPDFVLFQNQTGVILDANQAFLELVRRPKEAVLARPFSDFLPPDKAPLFNEKLAEAFQGHKVEFEVDVQLKGAESRVLNVTKVPLRVDGQVTGVHMVAKDITVEAASRSIIAQQARRLNTIFESITDAFFLLDRRWTFSFINSEVERLLGMSREQLLGKTAWLVFMGESLGEFHRQFQVAMTTGNAVHFQAFFKPRQLWLEVRVFPSEEGLSVYFTDVTDKVKAHEELYRQNQDLQQFAYIVSHNLRAPLANMLGLVDLLIDQPREQRQAPEYEQLLHHLLLNTRQLDTVLHDMNTILTVRDKQGVSEPEQVPLAEVVQQVVESLQDPLDQCKGEVYYEIPVGLCVRGTRAYLYSVFFNLLSNAIKYRSEERPLRITIVAQPSQPGPGTQVEVTDNGSGFDTQKAGADIFKLYKRFHTQPEGRGLGLYLVKTHVEAMGGRITVTSTVNVGTQFVVHLS
ncbi:sensor histidine kinase [Hymenobacter glacieicola]|uniref:histidine kinase n=1 Tax=Hymenobacter glacieicola TaxID=1562124 RepID=A0ABQ1X5T9_9BACT|nr:PAS domain-containing sensor histidine kinase [Hymenobacter glacieicola]GGG57517.1 hypothetical protein GCM10011378_36990 [Hymenobacter glacieicola]